MTTTSLSKMGLIYAVLVVFMMAGCTTWNETFGGPDCDEARYIRQTRDRGYITVGITFSYGSGSSDVWLIKTDSFGNKQWEKLFGGPGYDDAWSVEQTLDGGYIVAGDTNSFGAGNGDAWLIKTDENGLEEWTKTFGGPNSDRATFAEETTDGGFIITGWTHSYGHGNDRCMWLIKTDALGNMEWDRVFESIIGDLSGQCVRQTRDGGFIVLVDDEVVQGQGGSSVVLIKTDALGNKQWEKTFGWMEFDDAWYVQQTTDGGFIVPGRSTSNMPASSFTWLLKTDEYGSGEWHRTFNDGSFRSVDEIPGNGYIVCGESWKGTDGDLWLIRTDVYGNKIWDKTFGGSELDKAYSVQETMDGGYIIAGLTGSFGAGSWDLWLIKTDVYGNAPPIP